MIHTIKKRNGEVRVIGKETSKVSVNFDLNMEMSERFMREYLTVSERVSTIKEVFGECVSECDHVDWSECLCGM